MRIGILITAASLALIAHGGPAFSQASEEDLLKRFQTHQSTHRGLSLAPVTSAGATAAGSAKATQSAASAQPAPAKAASKPAATTVAPASPAPAPAATAVAPAESVEYVRMPEDSQINIRIEFDLNSASLRPSEFEKLQTLCSAIKRSDVRLFHIFGHTDASGSDAYNLNLSRLRAEEVRRRMVNDCQIEASRLRAIGVGEQYLLTPDAPNAAENRRVEFQAVS